MKLKINNVVKYLVLSDLIFFAGWGLITPIFAIFVLNNIQGGSIFVVGVASAIYWILASILRIPFGILLDNCKGERDDYFFLLTGLFIASLIPFGYIFAKFPWHIYILQAIYGVGMSMSLSGWPAIFTRHIDKGKEATEWGLDATSVGLGTGISAIIGAWAVTKFGFNPVFIAVGLIGLVGVFLLLFIRKDMKKGPNHSRPFNIKDIFQKR